MARKLGLVSFSVDGVPYTPKADSSVSYDTRNEMTSESVPGLQGRAGRIIQGMVPYMEVELVCSPAEVEEIIRVEDASIIAVFRDGSALSGQLGGYVGESSANAADGSTPCRFEFDDLDFVGA